MNKTILLSLPWSRNCTARTLRAATGREMARQAARLIRQYARQRGVSAAAVIYSVEG